MSESLISLQQIEAARAHVVKETTFRQLAFEINYFDSGAYIIDIDLSSDTLVVQLTDHYLGLSLLGDNLSFTTLPDFSYFTLADFRSVFDEMISKP